MVCYQFRFFKKYYHQIHFCFFLIFKFWAKVKKTLALSLPAENQQVVSNVSDAALDQHQRWNKVCLSWQFFSQGWPWPQAQAMANQQAEGGTGSSGPREHEEEKVETPHPKPRDREVRRKEHHKKAKKEKKDYAGEKKESRGKTRKKDKKARPRSVTPSLLYAGRSGRRPPAAVERRGSPRSCRSAAGRWY